MRRFSSFGSLGKQIAGLMEGRSEHTSQWVSESKSRRKIVSCRRRGCETAREEVVQRGGIYSSGRENSPTRDSVTLPDFLGLVALLGLLALADRSGRFWGDNRRALSPQSVKTKVTN